MSSQIARITQGLESLKGLIVPQLAITKSAGAWIDWTTATVVAQWWSSTKNELLFETTLGDQLVVAADAITLSPTADPLESDIARSGSTARYAKWGEIPPSTIFFRLTIKESNTDASVEINSTWTHRPEFYVGAGLAAISETLTVEVGGVIIELTFSMLSLADIVALYNTAAEETTPASGLKFLGIEGSTPKRVDVDNLPNASLILHTQVFS